MKVPFCVQRISSEQNKLKSKIGWWHFEPICLVHKNYFHADSEIVFILQRINDKHLQLKITSKPEVGEKAKSYIHETLREIGTIGYKVDAESFLGLTKMPFPTKLSNV